MPRPKSGPLTQRELEVMHVFWRTGSMTAADARDQLESGGRTLTYTTVATLCRLLEEKGFLVREGASRPFTFAASKSFGEVSSSLVKDLVEKVFAGSREGLLMQLFGGKQLSKREREAVESLLRDAKPGDKR